MDETELERMVVRLTGDGASYQSMLQKAVTSSTQAATNVEAATKRIEGMTSNLKGFASGAVSLMAGFGLATSLQGAFEAFEKFEGSQIRLKNNIEATGRSAQGVIGDYKAYADALMNVTTASKGEIFSLLEQADRMGMTGEAAKQLTTNAIAFGAATGKSAQEGFQAARALETGNIQMLKRQLFGRGAKIDDSKVIEASINLLKAGMKTAEEQAQTAGGQIEKFQRTFKGLSIEIGGAVSQGIQPFVKWLTDLIEIYKGFTPESKKLVMQFAAITLGILAIGPVLSGLSFLLAPLGAAFGFVASAIAFLATPIGLATALIIGIGLYLTDTGMVVEWFGEQWGRLKDYIAPAVKGIQDALTAGDVALAARIMWAQIKSAFADATFDIRQDFDKFTTNLARGFLVISTKVQEIYETAKAKMEEAITMKKFELFQLTEAEAEAEFQRINNELNNTIKRIRTEAAGIEEQLNIAANKAGDDAKKEVERLKADLAALNKEAADKVAEMPAPKARLKLDPVVPKIPTQSAKVNLKFDAAAFNSAEARFRVAEFMDKLENPQDFKKKHGGIGGEVKKFDAVPAGGAEAVGREDKQANLQARANELLEGILNKPVADINPANV